MTELQWSELQRFHGRVGVIIGVVVVFAILSVMGMFGRLAVTADQTTRVIDNLKHLQDQMDLLKGQNQWSIEDRQGLHENQKEIREALKRLEARK